jgi:hypothetical protein
MDNARLPLCLCKEDAKHILMNHPEIRKWRMEFVNTKTAE